MKNEKDFQYSCLQFMMCDPNICMYMRYDRILYVIQYFFFLYSTTKKKVHRSVLFLKKRGINSWWVFFFWNTKQHKHENHLLCSLVLYIVVGNILTQFSYSKFLLGKRGCCGSGILSVNKMRFRHVS